MESLEPGAAASKARVLGFESEQELAKRTGEGSRKKDWNGKRQSSWPGGGGNLRIGLPAKMRV